MTTLPILRLVIPAGNGPTVDWTGDETYSLREVGLPGIPDSSRSPPGVIAEALLADGGWDTEMVFALTDADGAVLYRGSIADAAGLTAKQQGDYVARSGW